MLWWVVVVVLVVGGFALACWSSGRARKQAPHERHNESADLEVFRRGTDGRTGS